MNIQSLHSGTKYCVCVSVPASVCVLFYRAWVKLWNMTKCSFLTLIKLTKNSSSLRDVAELHNHSNWQLHSKRATCTGGQLNWRAHCLAKGNCYSRCCLLSPTRNSAMTKKPSNYLLKCLFFFVCKRQCSQTMSVQFLYLNKTGVKMFPRCWCLSKGEGHPKHWIHHHPQ